jgi:dipeptidyl aminopeptidase/acylaminoacyl peptidase
VAFFQGREAGKAAGIYVVDTKDNSKNQLVREGSDIVNSWSADGKYLLLRSQDRRMSLLPLAGDRKPIPVGSPNGRSSGGRLSPDGKFIAFTSDESGRNEIYVQPMPPGTGQIKVSIGGGSNPRWRRDGKELFFVSDGGSIMAADVMPGPAFSPGLPHRLFEIKDAGLPAAFVSEYDVRPDGQRFLIYLAQKTTQDAPITVVLNWWAGLRQQP